MKTYKHPKEAFKEVQKKALKLTIPLFILAAIIGLWASNSPVEINNLKVIILTILLGVVSGGIGLYIGLSRQKKYLKVFYLRLTRTQFKEINIIPLK